jgi:hypothetical protein
MPDLLSHYGVAYLALRRWIRPHEVLWVLFGALSPDLGWILRRSLSGLFHADALALSPWIIPWHTPWTQAWVALALAFWTRHPARTFACLAGGVLTHFLLDAAQTRFGNGLVFGYPFHLGEVSWRLFWPEDPANFATAAAGLIVMAVLLLRPGARPTPGPSRALPPVVLRLAVTAGALALVVATALSTPARLVEANVYAMGFLDDPEAFTGRTVALDRTRVVAERPPTIEAPGHRRFVLAGVPPPALRVGQVVSVVGTYRAGAIHVERLHRHLERLRSALSYLGLLLLTALLVRERLRPRSGAPGPATAPR